MAEIHRTVTRGVTTIWTEAPAPLRAGLMFRTGRADETLTTAGLTHLVEHMALSAVDDPSHRNNGFVGDSLTGFVTLGSAEGVSSSLSAFCRHLSHLPGDRLETEKRVLAAEAATRSYDLVGEMLARRYGASGYGLRCMPELGCADATIDQLRDWAGRVFTRCNAVLWLTGPPPSDLRLELPDGLKRPLPVRVSLPSVYPRWFVDDHCGGIAAGAIVPRTPSATLLNELVANRLNQALRTEQAISYAPGVEYEPLDSDVAHFVMRADSDPDPDRRRELADAFGEVFERLDDIDDVELDVTRAQVIERLTGSLAPPVADVGVGEVQRAAVDWLFGKEFDSIQELAAEIACVTKEDVAEQVGELKRSVLFAMPSEVPIRPWMGEQLVQCEGSPVDGQEILSLDAPIRRERLVHGSDGVSIRWSTLSHITVRYSRLAAVLCYEDGAVCLIGADATAVSVEPTLWRNGRAVCQEVVARIPKHLMVGQGPRSKTSIPRPTTTRLQRALASSQLFSSWSLIALSVVEVVLILSIMVPIALDMVDLDTGPVGIIAPALLVLLPLAIAGVTLYGGLRILKDGQAAWSLPKEDG